MSRRSRSSLAVLIIAFIGSIVSYPATGQDDSSKLRDEIVAQLSGVIAKNAAKAIPADEAYERATKLVVIDPQQITFAGGRPTWQLQPRRKL